MASMSPVTPRGCPLPVNATADAIECAGACKEAKRAKFDDDYARDQKGYAA
jgi:hypothetical protein